MCHQSTSWTEELPIILLGIQGTFKKNLGDTAAEMLYGQPIRFPGEFSVSRGEPTLDPTDFAKRLRDFIKDLRPRQVSRHGNHPVFVSKALAAGSYVLVRYVATPKLLSLSAALGLYIC